MLLDEVITAEFNIREVVLWSRGQLAESTYLLKKNADNAKTCIFTSHCFLHESSSGSCLAFNLTLSYIMLVQMKSLSQALPLWFSRGRSLAEDGFFLKFQPLSYGINEIVFYPSTPSG